MKKNIALLAGGDSGEYEVSLKSASMVGANLDRSKFEVYLIKMFGRDWYFEDEKSGKISVNKDDFSIELNGHKIHFDAVFMMIHGPPGENGKLQGYFDILGIPYTNCDVFTSSLTFNKYFTNQVVRMMGIKIPYSKLLVSENEYDAYKIGEEVGYPCFVKPNNGGSSLGITRVNQKEELDEALHKAFEVDQQILVEELISGTEVTCGLIDREKQPLIFPLTEIVPKKEFFDYEAKYSQGMADEITPARITETETMEVKRLSGLVYQRLNCKGIVRVDFILRNNEFYFLELNTVPGMSEASIVPQQIRTAGMKERDIFTMAIENAIGRFRN